MPFGLQCVVQCASNLPAAHGTSSRWSALDYIVYLDDIIIFRKSIEKHLEQLSDVFARLKGAGLKIRPKRCRLLQTTVQYLGPIISGEGEGARTDQAKVSCVANWPIPTLYKKVVIRCV